MKEEEKRILQLALLGLQSERARIESEISNINKKLGISFRDLNRIQKEAKRPKRKMTEAQKRKIAQSMTLRWAEKHRSQRSSKA